MRVLVTRPEEDAKRLVRKLAGLGIESVVEPMMDVVFIKDTLDLSDVQALVFTSANGARACANIISDFSFDAYIVAVGRATAKAAEEAGFRHIRVADGDVDSVADLINEEFNPDEGAILHVAGSHVAGDLAGLISDAGFEYRRIVLYEAKARPALSADVAKAIAEGAFKGVLFYSPRTARLFVERVKADPLADKMMPAIGEMTAYCLSEAVAEEAAALDWKWACIAARPDEGFLLQAVHQDSGAGGPVS